MGLCSMAMKLELQPPTAILGIKLGASADEIRCAYKKRLLETHPDKGGLPEDFRAVCAAYATLSGDHPVALTHPASSASTRERTPRRIGKPRKPPSAKAKAPLQRQVSPRAVARAMGFFPPQRSAFAFAF